MRSSVGTAILILSVFASSSALGTTELSPDAPGVVVSLRMPPSPHWIWVNDIDFPHMPDGRAALIDGDSGRFLGVLDTGFSFSRMVAVKDGRVIFSPETYFSRGTRGTRTDVVTIYDSSRLAPIGEIPIPPKRSSNMPVPADAGLTDDGRFLLIYNFTPAQSVTIVDVLRRVFVGKIDTPGCALVYPTGSRSFFSICGDGALLDAHLADTGHLMSLRRTGRMFDVKSDPATEKGVRVGNTWYFVSYSGFVYPVRITPRGLRPGARWSLLTAAERSRQWRPGGLQQLAAHTGLDRLYTIMHQGGLATHKDPGKEVWVYDLSTRARIQRIALKNESSSIQVSPDAHPLLFSAFIGSSTLDIYDARSGEYLRSVKDVATTPTVLVSP